MTQTIGTALNRLRSAKAAVRLRAERDELRRRLDEAAECLKPFAWKQTRSSNPYELFHARVMDGNRAAALLATLTGEGK